MHNLRSSSLPKLAKVCSRLSSRLKSAGGRPSAPLGSRILTNPDDIFKHNMWDHVQWTEEDKENARQKAEENSYIQIPLKEQGKFDTEACQYWDKFYSMHQDKFFKDRKWLFLEFPELLPSAAKSRATNSCLDDQQAAYPLPTGSSTDTETRHQQHNGLIHLRRSTDTSNQQSCQRAAPEKDEAAIQTTAFPGQHASFRILEVGCGVGNSVFPIVNSIKETDAFLYCCDFSPCAIQLVKVIENCKSALSEIMDNIGLHAIICYLRLQGSPKVVHEDMKTIVKEGAPSYSMNHPDYNDSVCRAFVHDICDEMASFPFPSHSLDVILAVFVLSSIHPDRIQGIVNRLSKYLKHGGIFLFRDYGRYDFSQLRFKKGRCLSENFYTRGDGTCVYFFTKGEVHDLFSNAGLEEVQNLEDRRLQVNRGKKVVMHRVWMQSKYRKLYPPSPS